MKKFIALISAALVAAGAWAEVAVTAVKAQQRYPWNGKVDIEVQIFGTALSSPRMELLINCASWLR